MPYAGDGPVQPPPHDPSRINRVDVCSNSFAAREVRGATGKPYVASPLRRAKKGPGFPSDPSSPPAGHGLLSRGSRGRLVLPFLRWARGGIPNETITHDPCPARSPLRLVGYRMTIVSCGAYQHSEREPGQERSYAKPRGDAPYSRCVLLTTNGGGGMQGQRLLLGVTLRVHRRRCQAPCPNEVQGPWSIPRVSDPGDLVKQSCPMWHQQRPGRSRSHQPPRGSRGTTASSCWCLRRCLGPTSPHGGRPTMARWRGF